jgi:hypothetical protein
MQKIKIMLLSLTMVAFVGGALAFKANNKFGFRLCTVAPEADGTCFIDGVAKKCAFTNVNCTITLTGDIKVCYSLLGIGSCLNVTCPNLGNIGSEE